MGPGEHRIPTGPGESRSWRGTLCESEVVDPDDSGRGENGRRRAGRRRLRNRNRHLHVRPKSTGRAKLTEGVESGPIPRGRLAIRGGASLGCLLRFVGFAILFLALLIGARRLTERPTDIPPPAAQERDTVVDGVRWRSRERPAAPGSEALPPVVYVHGFLSSSSTWKQVIGRSEAGREAIAVDLPGSGFSDRPWPFDYTVFGQAQHLLRFLDARGWPRVVLVGNSLGGAVCEAVAVARPQRVAGLVLVDAASPLMRIPVGFRLLRIPVLGDLQIELLVRPVMAYALRRRLYANPARVNERTVDDWWMPIPVPGTRRAALASVRTRLAGSEGLLEKIRVPTLVLWGKEDALLDASEGLAIASRIPSARFVALPSAGHLPQEEVPAEFTREVAAFIERLDGGKR